MGEKFGRDRRDTRAGYRYNYDVEFEVESYLRYQGESFVEHFDANTYLLMTRALDYFDPAASADGDLAAALSGVTAPFFVASFTSDWRFPPAASHEIVRALLDTDKRVSYAEIRANQGHDAFLMPVPRYREVFATYMQRVAEEVGV